MDVSPARALRDAVDAYENGELTTAQLRTGEALDGILAERAKERDLVSEIAEALEGLDDIKTSQFPAAARDEASDIPTSWSAGGLHLDDVPALLARELAMVTCEVEIVVEPQQPGKPDHHYQVTFDIDPADGAGPDEP